MAKTARCFGLSDWTRADPSLTSNPPSMRNRIDGMVASDGPAPRTCSPSAPVADLDVARGTRTGSRGRVIASRAQQSRRRQGVVPAGGAVVVVSTVIGSVDVVVGGVVVVGGGGAGATTVTIAGADTPPSVSRTR